MAITDPTLDPVTGIPLDASYATQYQVPLGSQPINLDELNAQGKQSNWLYPDNLPPVVARLQARDLTNPGNAQDLSTDGQRNLNVNINALNPAVKIGDGGGSVTPTQHSDTASGGTGPGSQFIDFLPKIAEIYGVTCGAYIDQGVYTNSIVRNWWLVICEYGNEFHRFILAMGQVGENASGDHLPMGNGSVNIRFNPPIIPPKLNPDSGYGVAFILPVNDWEMWYSIDYLPG